jgi:hypothetical protein
MPAPGEPPLTDGTMLAPIVLLVHVRRAEGQARK